MLKKISILVLVFVCTLFISGCGSSNSFVANTKWLESDGSELIFKDDTIAWYKDPNVYNDNYYSGTYKIYRADEAVDFITTNLSSYNVTRDELDSLFARSTYSKEDFIVVDIYYDKFIIDGKSQTISKPHVPWYGFILKNDTYLDVANMNTGTYYKFTKQ